VPSGLIDVPLGLQLAFPGGTVRHDFAGLPGPRLVRTLARAHLSMTNSGGAIKTTNTSQAYASAIRAVAWFFFERCDSDDLRGLDAAGYRRLTAALGSRHLEGLVRALLGRCEELDRDALHPGVRPLLTAPYIHEWSPSTPIAPLPESDAKRLETACKASIVAIEACLAEGTRMLADVPDPGALDELQLIERQIVELVARVGLTGCVPKRLRRDRRVRYVEELVALVFPTLTDLVPFLLLLGLRTGLNPESLDTLAVDAFEDLGDGHVRLRWFKARGGGHETDTFSGRGRWSAGGLLRRASAVTARARLLAPPAVRDRLWLYSPSGGRRPIRAVGGLVPVPGWVTSVDLRDGNGELLSVDRRRLRKTHSRRLNHRYHGALELVAGANQSTRVAAEHYVDTSPANPVLTATITDAQTALLDRARATVVTEDSLARVAARPADAAMLLDTTEDTAATLLGSEDLDVFVAKCKDFHNSPFAAPGIGCPAAAWECLFCRLAVITPSKAPALIALKRRLEQLRDTIPLEQWHTIHGPAHRVISEEILPQFSATTISRAEGLADTEVLHLPLAVETA